jgi:hypothetical protein
VATGAQEHIDVTTAAEYIPEIWSKYVIKAREDALVFARLVTRKYEDDLSYGDIIHVPLLSNLTSRTKNLSANTAVTYETVTETAVTITVGTWSYAAIAIESATKKQTYKDMVQLYAPKMGFALALAVDDDLAALVDDLTTNSVGTLASPPTYSQFNRARRLLNDANVPQSGRWSIFSPAAEEGLMELDQFIRNDYSKLQGRENSEEDMAYMGSWFRVPVYMSTNVEGTNAAGHDNVMAHTEAFALVMQMSPTTHKWFDIDYLADKVVSEQLYGVKTMRDDHAVWFKAA